MAKEVPSLDDQLAAVRGLLTTGAEMSPSDLRSALAAVVPVPDTKRGQPETVTRRVTYDELVRILEGHTPASLDEKQAEAVRTAADKDGFYSGSEWCENMSPCFICGVPQLGTSALLCSDKTHMVCYPCAEEYWYRTNEGEPALGCPQCRGFFPVPGFPTPMSQRAVDFLRAHQGDSLPPGTKVALCSSAGCNTLCIASTRREGGCGGNGPAPTVLCTVHTRNDVAVDMEALEARAIKCPNPACGYATDPQDKTECNHMSCPNQNCRADWCWVCQEFFLPDNPYTIYDHFEESGCPQFPREWDSGSDDGW
jgi:hypothetical protein